MRKLIYMVCIFLCCVCKGKDQKAPRILYFEDVKTSLHSISTFKLQLNGVEESLSAFEQVVVKQDSFIADDYRVFDSLSSVLRFKINFRQKMLYTRVAMRSGFDDAEPFQRFLKYGVQEAHFMKEIWIRREPKEILYDDKLSKYLQCIQQIKNQLKPRK